MRYDVLLQSLLEQLQDLDGLHVDAVRVAMQTLQQFEFVDTYINLHILFSFLELSRPRARPPGAGRLEVEGFGWAWD